nr:hypothetical protein [Tanacetum cinerariifolium]
MEEVMLPCVHHDFFLWGKSNRAAKTKYNTNLARLLPKQIYSSCMVDWNVLNNLGCVEAIKEILKIKVDYWFISSSEEELHLSKSLTSNIRSPVLKFITRIARRMSLLIDEVLDGLIDQVYCRALDTTTLREMINSKRRLILEDPALGVREFLCLDLRAQLCMLEFSNLWLDNMEFHCREFTHHPGPTAHVGPTTLVDPITHVGPSDSIGLGRLSGCGPSPTGSDRSTGSMVTSGQATTLPHAFIVRTLHDLDSGA